MSTSRFATSGSWLRAYDYVLPKLVSAEVLMNRELLISVLAHIPLWDERITEVRI
jgi:hypothetical protein